MLQGLASTLSSRLTSAALTFPATRQWVQVGYVLGTTAAIALPVGFASRFLEVSPVRDVGTVVRGAAIAFLVPGISEEVSDTWQPQCAENGQHPKLTVAAVQCFSGSVAP